MGKASQPIDQKILENCAAMNTNKVVAIDSAKDWETAAPDHSPDSGTGATQVVTRANLARLLDSSHSQESKAELTPRDLYADAPADSRIARALDLIERAKKVLEKARDTDRAENFFEFDEQLITAHALLKKAFRCREIGDGYAAIINALNWALANRPADSLNKRQLGSMLAALERLLHGPFIHFDSAMAIMDELETAELDIEPPALALLTSSLDD